MGTAWKIAGLVTCLLPVESMAKDELQGNVDMRFIEAGSSRRSVQWVLSARNCIFRTALKEARRRPSDDIEPAEKWEGWIKGLNEQFAELKMSTLPCSKKEVRLAMACLSSIHGPLNTPVGCPRSIYDADREIPLDFDYHPLPPFFAAVRRAAKERFDRAWVGTSDDWVSDPRNSHKTTQLIVRVLKGNEETMNGFIAYMQSNFADGAAEEGIETILMESPGIGIASEFPLVAKRKRETKPLMPPTNLPPPPPPPPQAEAKHDEWVDPFQK